MRKEFVAAGLLAASSVGALGMAGTASADPVVLTTKDPGKVVANLTQLPPTRELGKFQNPVGLVVPAEQPKADVVAQGPGADSLGLGGL